MSCIYFLLSVLFLICLSILFHFISWFLAQTSFEAILDLYQPGLGLHTDICYMISLNAFDKTLAAASNHILQSIWDLKFVTKSYCNTMSEFEHIYQVWENKRSCPSEKY